MPGEDGGVTDEPRVELQFDRAELPQTEGAGAACKACGGPVGSAYYAVNGQVACERCKIALERQRAQGSPVVRFLLAGLLGIGGGVVGAGVWYAVAALAHLEIGIIAILVGYLVGTGVRKGSHGRGGRGYQALAVLITYASIASTNVPLILRSVHRPGVGTLFGVLNAFLFSLTIPFLGGFENIIGILIIGIALWEAWKLNQETPLEITGPHLVGRG
jgi:hypothetical protein